MNYVDLWGLSASDADATNDIPIGKEAQEPLWDQIGEGIITTAAGVALAVISVKVIITSGTTVAEPAGAALLTSIQIAGYGITQIITGATGHDVPSTFDFIKEILSSGFADTDFDGKKEEE